MARRCKNKGCSKELPPTSKCKDALSKMGFCSYECQVSVALEKAEEARRRRLAKQYHDNTASTKKAARKPVTKAEDMSIGDLTQTLQRETNKLAKIVNDRDECISCGIYLPTQNQVDGGHFIAVGQCKETRFNLSNIHPQCTNCNNHLGGNYIEYERQLRTEFGDDHVDYLLNLKRIARLYPVRWDRSGLLSMLRYVRKELKKHRK